MGSCFTTWCTDTSRHEAEDHRSTSHREAPLHGRRGVQGFRRTFAAFCLGARRWNVLVGRRRLVSLDAWRDLQPLAHAYKNCQTYLGRGACLLSVHERVTFRLITLPCCKHQLCWVNPRMPMFCPECGHGPFIVMGDWILLTDDHAELVLSKDFGYLSLAHNGE